MKTLTFHVSDELYKAFQQAAAEEGRSVEQVAMEWLAKNAPKPRPKLTKAERRAARERLLRHAGSIEGDPHSADNDRIDAQLAKEYANNHEEGQ